MRSPREATRERRRRGTNIIEFSLLIPWYVFLFVGAFDYGFFAYSLITTQNAASVVGTYASANSTSLANWSAQCGYALDQFRNLPNVGSSMSMCGTAAATTSNPVAILCSSVTGPDSNPAAQCQLYYLTPQLIPIPGLLPGQLTITRTVKMRMRG